MSKPSIEFFTTDELWEELSKRFNACIFVGNHDAQNKDEHTDYYYCRFVGCRTWILGLTQYANRRVYDEMVDQEGPVEYE